MLVKDLLSKNKINFKTIKIIKSKPFNEKILETFDKISKRILLDKKMIKKKDIFTFGFWCRRKNLEILKKRFCTSNKILGIGLVFHVPPANIPVLPLYSLAFGTLTGNSNLIRIPKKNIDYLNQVISIIYEEFKLNEFHKNNLFISYDRENSISEKISSYSDVRMIWGGDKTIKLFKKFKTKINCKDMMFGDKYSIAILHLKNKDKNKIKEITKNFYNDTFIVDQNACSSPSIIFWYRTNKDVKLLFWHELNKLVKSKYQMSFALSSKRFEYLNDLLMNYTNISLLRDKKNYFFRIKINSNHNIENFKGFAGIFFEKNLNSLINFNKFLNKKMQTLSFYGLYNNDLIKINKEVSKNKTIDRIVELGRTLEIDFIWDGKNIFKSLTKYYGSL